MKERVYRRGLATRAVQTFNLDDPALAAAAALTGPLAWLERVETAATAVLERHGYRVARDRLGLCRPDEAPWPDPNVLEAPGLAAKVVETARGARIVLAGSNVQSAFEWGAKLMQAARMLDAELAGWPLAAERGHRSKIGQDKASDPDLRARAMRWCDEVAAAVASGHRLSTAESEIAARDGVPFRTVQSAVNRERKRRGFVAEKKIAERR